MGNVDLKDRFDPGTDTVSFIIPTAKEWDEVVVAAVARGNDRAIELESQVIALYNYIAEKAAAAAPGADAVLGVPSMKSVRRLVYMTERKRKLEDELNAAKADIALFEEDVVTYMQEEGVKNLSIDGNKVYLAPDIKASFRNDDEAVACAEEHGLGDALKMTIHPARAKSIVKEFAQQYGDKMPEWVGTIFSYTEGLRPTVRKD